MWCWCPFPTITISFSEDDVPIQVDDVWHIDIHIFISYIKDGLRHGNPIVYTVLSGEMYKNGYVFYRSVNGVWLTNSVPVEFLRKNDKI